LKGLRARGVAVEEVRAETAHEAEQAAIDLAGVERLVVMGGDGMVHLAIQAVAQTDTVLGILPLGTGNDFARGLGLSTDLDQAVEAALGDPTPIDLMRIGDRWGASVATAGFSVAVNARANNMRWPRGANRYTLATLREAPRLGVARYELNVDGATYDLPAVLVTIANTPDFGGGMRISPKADATDGRLDITVVGAVGRIELLLWFRKVFEGTHLDSPKVTTLQGTEISINAPETEIWADGEPVADSPVTIRAVAGALALAGVGSLGP
jgi:diacylglycerol kinase (ATP)